MEKHDIWSDTERTNPPSCGSFASDVPMGNVKGNPCSGHLLRWAFLPLERRYRGSRIGSMSPNKNTYPAIPTDKTTAAATNAPE
jgi:hypothetical protein